MEPGSSQVRSTRSTRQGPAGRWIARATRRRTGDRAEARGDGTMQPEARFGHAEAAAHPLAELLECPPAIGNLLNASAQYARLRNRGDGLSPGRALPRALRGGFRAAVAQDGAPEYAADAGTGARRETWWNWRPRWAMDIILIRSRRKLRRRCCCCRSSRSSRLSRRYPPLRMQLLEELAREVSRAYNTCCLHASWPGVRHRSNGHDGELSSLTQVSGLETFHSVETQENPCLAPRQSALYFNLPCGTTYGWIPFPSPPGRLFEL